MALMTSESFRPTPGFPLQRTPIDNLERGKQIQMLQLSRSKDCGNSPKNKMVENIAIALEARDIDFLTSMLDTETEWNYVAGTATTAAAILVQVGELDKPSSLTVDHVISHGKVGAVNGYARKGKSEQRFCHVIEFTSVKCNRIRRIESYGE
jgi:hypothetical protein